MEESFNHRFTQVLVILLLCYEMRDSTGLAPATIMFSVIFAVCATAFGEWMEKKRA